jgi:CubicO group peptidase (beta-lactamase class C family)
VTEAGSPKILTSGAQVNYGYFWWTFGSGQSAADGAFFALGIMGQQIYVNRKEKVVIVVWGAQTNPDGDAGILPLTPFFDAVVEAVRNSE